MKVRTSNMVYVWMSPWCSGYHTQHSYAICPGLVSVHVAEKYRDNFLSILWGVSLVSRISRKVEMAQFHPVFEGGSKRTH